jgi:hypothetical protein
MNSKSRDCYIKNLYFHCDTLFYNFNSGDKITIIPVQTQGKTIYSFDMADVFDFCLRHLNRLGGARRTSFSDVFR